MKKSVILTHNMIKDEKEDEESFEDFRYSFPSRLVFHVYTLSSGFGAHQKHRLMVSCVFRIVRLLLTV